MDLIRNRILPQKPNLDGSVKEILWKLCIRCWDYDTTRRITANEARPGLQNLSIFYHNLKHFDRTSLVHSLDRLPLFNEKNVIYTGVYSRTNIVHNARRRTNVKVSIECWEQIDWKDDKHVKVRSLFGSPFVRKDSLSIKVFRERGEDLVDSKTREYHVT